MNIQSVYRGERFKIRTSTFASKGTEPGLEITDLPGIMRSIISNPEGKSGRERKKVTLLLNLLQNKPFLSMLNSVNYYEWNSSSQLTEVEFDTYIQAFMSKHL
ncbi:MAG TPA: hypothetical protein VEY51_05980 [Chondromyces sp.]|nr:hypothetical protein [Chondromyces sp.]